MDDPWGNNAWSTAQEEEKVHNSNHVPSAPKWNAFERDADENTMDVGVPNWTAGSGSSWGDGTNLWHAESSTLDAWKPDANDDEMDDESDEKPEGTTTEEQSADDGKHVSLRPTLPTPPLSPLPVHSPPSITPPVEGSPLPSPPRPLTRLPSPDPFGSFESAELEQEEPDSRATWSPKEPHFPAEARDEPWGAAWGGDEEQQEDNGGPVKDEWELAQQARRKRDHKVPPELLGSLVTQWDEFAQGLYQELKSDDDGSQSWRKGLDSVDGLVELVNSLVPETSFPPPPSFSKTAVAKSVKETLRLTRSFPLTQSSPMARLYASKGSTDWEKSVKAQKISANDEWGWDLKHEPEETEPVDLAKDKKGGGLLSFWSRRASSIPTTPATECPTPTQMLPSGVPKPTPPVTSSPPSTETPAVPVTFPSVESPTFSSPASLAPDASATPVEDSLAQPSAVSRFFNRFSRKPSATGATTSLDRDKPASLALSSDDLSFLSDMGPSSSSGSVMSPRGSDSAGSLEAMLSMPMRHQRYSSASSSKLPPPLAPPPPPSTFSAGPTSATSDTSNASFDAKMAEVQFLDLLGNMAGSGDGYAPVSFDLLESPVENRAQSSAFRSPALPPPVPLPLSPRSRVQPPTTPPVSGEQRPQGSRTPTLSPMLSQLSPVPVASSAPSRSQDLSALTPPPLPPVPPPHSSAWLGKTSSTLARFDNPLPPTPKRDLDDLDNFLSASLSGDPKTPPRHRLPSPPGPSVSSAPSADDFPDFGDFGDFISTPVGTPPPKVPQKTPCAMIHKPAQDLVERAASRPGRWPTAQSPLPQPLAPPPRPSSGIGHLGKQSMPQSQRDLLSYDDSPGKVTPAFSSTDQNTVLPPPLFAPPSRHTSMSFLGFPTPPPVMSSSRSSTPMSLPPSAAAKPAGTSGLSAQDLSFFEGL